MQKTKQQLLICLILHFKSVFPVVTLDDITMTYRLAEKGSSLWSSGNTGETRKITIFCQS